ncbi:MAG: glucose-6-phosphate isomerase family protein [Minisyncoccales bacterium]
MKNKKPEIRYLFDLKKVLYDQKWLKTAQNFPLYFMYRGIKRKNGLRYDLTIIPPKKLGQEFVKTLGHEHLNNYGELYLVLKGEAIYLIQRSQKNKKNQIVIKDIYAVKAKKGQVVIIPPGYGHITINPSTKKLKMANWVFEKCKNSYQIFKKMRGGGYFYTINGWQKNKNYAFVPQLKFKRPLKNLPTNLNFLLYAPKN